MRSILCLSGTGLRCKLLAKVIESQQFFTAIAASSCKEAIHILKNHKIDTIIIDIEDRLPNLETLLQVCQARFPQIYRFFIRGTHLSPDARKLISYGNASFPMPTNSVELSNILNKILRDYPVEEIRAEDVVQKVTIEEKLSNLLATFEDMTPSFRYLYSCVNHDHELSRLVLNRINSPFYGLPSRVDSVDRAIRLMGVESVITLFDEIVKRSLAKVA